MFITCNITCYMNCFPNCAQTKLKKKEDELKNENINKICRIMADAAYVFIMFWFLDLNRIEPTETTLLDFISPTSWVSLSYGRKFACFSKDNIAPMASKPFHVFPYTGTSLPPDAQKLSVSYVIEMSSFWIS